jgi:pimeloyl-ACP methyl ester carboxylesterase
MDVNGTELAYVEEGQGEPLIFVHGSLGDSRTWHFQMKPFAKHYRTIAYSRRYHHPNKWSGDRSDYSMTLHAEDLAALIRKLDLRQVYLVGSSYGAYTSLFFTIHNPGIVRALVLSEPPMLPWLEQSAGGKELHAAFLAEAWEPAKAAFERGELEQGVRAFIDGVLGKGAFDRLPPPVRASMMDNALEMKAETTAPDYFATIACEDVQQVTVPTLLLNGERSPRMFHVIADEVARCLPNVEHATIPNVSHSTNANTQAFNETVLAFLAKQSAPV